MLGARLTAWTGKTLIHIAFTTISYEARRTFALVASNQVHASPAMVAGTVETVVLVHLTQHAISS